MQITFKDHCSVISIGDATFLCFQDFDSRNQPDENWSLLVAVYFGFYNFCISSECQGSLSFESFNDINFL